MYIAPIILILGIIFLQYLPSSTTERLFQIQDQVKERDLTGRIQYLGNGSGSLQF